MNKCLKCDKECEDLAAFCTECTLTKLAEEDELKVRSLEQLQSEQIKRDYQFTELEIQKINLQKGDTLMITIKHDYVENDQITALSNEFKKHFPNNRVFMFNMGTDGEIKFAVVSQEEKTVAKEAPVGYCSDCSCGKKEALEGK